MAKKSEYHKYTVDIWATALHDVEIGILPSTQHRAKSRQFTKDMDIFGEVKEEKGRTHILAYRKGLWKDNVGMEKRLVIKQFTAGMNWRATMDLLLGRSLQLSHGAGGFPVPAFSINVSGHDQIIQVERSAFKWPLFPEKFSFFILDEGKPQFFRLRKVWMSIGADYKLYDQYNRKIGYLDGKVINLGGAWKVKIRKEYSNAQLNSVIQLFCAMLKFNTESRNHIDHLLYNMHRGAIIPALQTQESDLYMNPRRTR